MQFNTVRRITQMNPINLNEAKLTQLRLLEYIFIVVHITIITHTHAMLFFEIYLHSTSWMARKHLDLFLQ